MASLLKTSFKMELQALSKMAPEEYWENVMIPSYGDAVILERGIFTTENESIAALKSSGIRYRHLDKAEAVNVLRGQVIAAWDNNDIVGFYEYYYLFTYAKAQLPIELSTGGLIGKAAGDIGRSYMNLATILRDTATPVWYEKVFALGWNIRAKYEDVTINA